MSLVLLVLSVCFTQVFSHGAMVSPPARNAAAGEYNWHSGNEGAQEGDWNSATNLCGYSRYQAPGPITATYTSGQTINIEIAISAFHAGYYEFRLCNPSSGRAPSSNAEMYNCLQSAPLLQRVTPLANGQLPVYKISSVPTWTTQQYATRWRQDPEDGAVTGRYFDGNVINSLAYKLPAGVTCSNCVLHWYWQSLNNWQAGPANTLATTTGERFWNCADIAITGSGGSTPTPTPSPRPTPTPAPTPTPTPTPSTGSSTLRCGVDWKTANSLCGVACPSATNADCPSGQSCFRDLSPCSGTFPTPTPTPNPTPTPTAPSSDYCNTYCPCSSTPPTSTGSCVAWNAVSKYTTGTYVSYQGSYYKCLQPHSSNTAWTPSTTPTLWQKVSSCGATTYSLEDGAVTTLDDGSSGSSSDVGVPGWGIALICLAAAILVTQVVFFVYRFKQDMHGERI